MTATVPILLDRLRAGDADAFGALIGQLYAELRRLAHAQRRRLGEADTLNTTAIVHEAYAKLDRRATPLDALDRAHLFRIVAQAMRDVIVDYARARQRDKRGGGQRPLSLDDAGVPGVAAALDADEVLGLHEALGRLAALDAETAQVVELRYFAGLSIGETADALGLSPATVKRRWGVARAWLYDALQPPAAP